MAETKITGELDFNRCYQMRSQTPFFEKEKLEGVVIFEGKIYRVIRPLEFIDENTVVIKFNTGNIKVFPLEKITDGAQKRKVSIGIVLDKKELGLLCVLKTPLIDLSQNNK
jgi:hypothetical protein